MVQSDPILNEDWKFLDVCKEGVRLSFCGHADHVVIESISLAAASIKELQDRGDRRIHCNGCRLECSGMMARADDSITFTQDNHLSGLQCCVVGRCEPAIWRQFRYCGILDITLHDRPQVIKLLLACLMRSSAVRGEQRVPTH